MKEADICTEIKHSAERYQSAWYHKISDVSPQLRAQQRFIPARPFDICFLYGGRFHAIEAKIVKTPTAFPFSRMTGFEMESLRDVSGAGGSAWVAIAYRGKATESQQDKYGLDTYFRFMYWLDITVFLGLQQGLERKSIPFDFFYNSKSPYDIDTGVYTTEWLGNGIWDLDIIVEN